MNCKPGDLAVIINDPQFNNVDAGKIVKVIKWAETDEDGNVFWECISIGGPLLSQELDGTITLDISCDICDTLLRPVRAEPESIDECQEITA